MAKYTTTIRNLIENTYPMEFLKKYPIFDEEYRPHLNYLILYNFYTREIAYETPERFVLAFGVKMELIMPDYNRKYLLQRKQDEEEPFKDTDMITTSTSHGIARNFDSPKSYIEDITNYMTDAANSDVNGDTHEVGYKNKLVADIVTATMNSYVNIDQMILEDLEPLFHPCW